MEKKDLLSYGVSDITYEEMCSIEGGNNALWFLLGLLVGGIEDFNAGYEEAQ